MIGKKPVEFVESYALVTEQTTMKASNHFSKTHDIISN